MNFGRKQRSGSDSLQITVTMLFQLPLPEPLQRCRRRRRRRLRITVGWPNERLKRETCTTSLGEPPPVARGRVGRRNAFAADEHADAEVAATAAVYKLSCAVENCIIQSLTV